VVYLFKRTSGEVLEDLGAVTIQVWISVIAYNGSIFPVPSPQTSKPEYASFLLVSLRGLGEASRDAVLRRTRELMKDRLKPADYSLLHRGRTPRWVNQADHMLDGLIEEGFIDEKNSKLRLTEKGLAYLESHGEP
jgi:hypothetical protein